MDPFAILGIAAAYDVDVVALERVHRELSRALHPDRYVGAPASERREALARAIAVNEAWRIVRDPVRRAEALLQHAGIPVGEDREPAASPEFLMDMLEQREALSAASGACDLATVRALAQEVRARSANVERELSSAFQQGASPDLVGKLGELRFYRRFLDEASAIEDELSVR
jgi:molecular chaperone HscB